jgi:hypothetical protein
MEATGRIIGWLLIAAIAYVTVRGTLPRYISILGA